MADSALTDTDREQIEAILTYWFGELRADDEVDPSKKKLWWMGGDDIDAEVERNFGDQVRAALAGGYRHWLDDARGCLALAILLDQFTRNLGRGTANAYAGDAAALEVCQAAIEGGLDRELRCVERSFLYMPMMHAEDRDVARRSIETFTTLSKEVVALGREDYPDFLSHAVKHADIVIQFGRYPHRNELLGRKATPEEEAFMADGGPTFGQKKR